MAIVTVSQAAELMNQGQVVAVPTETVYGLAAKISDESALKKVFTTKERPLFDPLIVHVMDENQAKGLALKWPSEIAALVAKFWPGPLTVVVPKKNVSDLITSGLETVGLRSPSHPLARKLLELAGPFAAPSANRFGRTSPTRSEHVLSEFSGSVNVVEGGECAVGLESTVVRWNGERRQLEVLRPGVISQQQLLDVVSEINPRAAVVRAQSQASPGNLEHHYQPRLPLVLADGPANAQARQAIAARFRIQPMEVYDLDLSVEAPLAARELYSRLHDLGKKTVGAIVFWRGANWPTPEWEALRDRLERAEFKA